MKSRRGGQRKSERRELKRLLSEGAPWRIANKRSETARFLFGSSDERAFNDFLSKLRASNLGYAAFGTSINGREGRVIIV